jgi:hypothetical protein
MHSVFASSKELFRPYQSGMENIIEENVFKQKIKIFSFACKCRQTPEHLCHMGFKCIGVIWKLK